VLAVSLMALAAIGSSSVGAELSRWNASLPRWAAAFALAAAIAALTAGVRWARTPPAGQTPAPQSARLFASGSVRRAAVGRVAVVAGCRSHVGTAGYVATSGPPGTIAPVCPAGLAIVMAIFSSSAASARCFSSCR
jgi:predicted MFS family arabinose efflux permease